MRGRGSPTREARATANPQWVVVALASRRAPRFWVGAGKRDMISRVAEHCFWMGRYLERAENTARVLDVNHTLLLDFEVPLEQQWKPLLIISGIHDHAGPFDAETVQAALTWDADNPCSVVASLAA